MCVQSHKSHLLLALLTDTPDCPCLSLKEERWESSKGFPFFFGFQNKRAVDIYGYYKKLQVCGDEGVARFPRHSQHLAFPISLLEEPI